MKRITGQWHRARRIDQSVSAAGLAVAVIALEICGCSSGHRLAPIHSQRRSVACPSSTQLQAAWKAAPASVRRQWASSNTIITKFVSINCWDGCVVSVPFAKGNGTFVFSERNGLNLLPVTQLQQFSKTVCSSSQSPPGWKNPIAGPARCPP
jgi:hypothetical protein